MERTWDSHKGNYQLDVCFLGVILILIPCISRTGKSMEPSQSRPKPLVGPLAGQCLSCASGSPRCLRMQHFNENEPRVAYNQLKLPAHLCACCLPACLLTEEQSQHVTEDNSAQLSQLWQLTATSRKNTHPKPVTHAKSLSPGKCVAEIS